MRVYLIERHWKGSDGPWEPQDYWERDRLYTDEEVCRREARLLTELGDHFEFRSAAYELVSLMPQEVPR